MWTRYGLMVPVMLAVAGCAAVPTPVAPPPQPAPVAAAPAPAPLPTPSRGWEERAVDAGGWRYDAGSRAATFVPTGSANPLLTMTCSGSGIRLTSALAGDVSLRTSAGTDQIRFDGGSATLPSRDPRLDRIAFSRGRFALETPGGGALTLPVQAEIGRVIEDCR
ncbi:MAG: hypothetical protein CVT78_14120 [Alphaproteobacteria bacterium HGW-Alphaproteobacteria-17]|nr:MAG: hypothetical protein CVT78_14120 [Alphaproteobacteria bacterium HGW-Alphaproteobacteria-17]